MTTIKGKTMKTATIIAICALLACGGDSPATWGEVAEEVANAKCWRSYKCGTSEDINVCMEHEIYHLCGIDGTCDEPVYGSAGKLAYQCTLAIHNVGCEVEFEWPENCLHAFEHLNPPGRQH